MTFKHTKFEDSSTMRSLVKLAEEKGWVKQEPLQKTAAAPKLDLTPTESFTENVLKLCAGLRASGFEKQAEEIESKFVQYKQATTSLYEVGNETGEDLVHAAHPKGSHKMEDIDNKEATFEDILDKHMQFMNVVEKKPTGKYASMKDILGAVKTVLADAETGDVDTGLTQPVIDNILSFFHAIDESLSSFSNRIIGVNENGVLAYNRLKSNFIKHINNHTINTTTISQINGMIDTAIQGFSTREFSKFFLISTPAENVLFQLKSLKNYVSDTVLDDHRSLAGAAGSNKVNQAGQQFASQVNTALGLLKSWAVTVDNDPENNENDKAQANNWINQRTSELNALLEKFNEITDPNEKNQEAPGFLGALTKSRFNRESAQFKKTWIG